MGERSPRQSGGLSSVALGGMLWAAFAAVATKSASFLSQLALGWLLAEDDFAIYALAISITSLVALLKDGGTQKLLIQRGDEYNDLARPILTLSLLFNGIAVGILLLVAHPLARWFEAPSLPPLIWVTAVSLLLACPAMVLRAKLTIDLKFAQVASLTTVSVFIKHGLMVVFALLGLGPLSFVLPLPIVAIFEWVAYYVLARKSSGFAPKDNRLTVDVFKDVFRSSRWIMLATLASALINQGDYFVIGKLAPAILGVYFFGFQISVAFTKVFTTGMRSVLMPTMAKISSDTERIAHGLLKSIRMVSWLIVPLCFVGIAMLPPLVDFLWSGKWNQAIPVAQIMVLSLVFRLLTPVAQAAMEARGEWRGLAILLLLDGLGTIVTAIIGSLFGGLITVTIAVAANRAMMALVQCVWAGRGTSASAKRILLAAVLPGLVASMTAVVAYILMLLTVGTSQAAFLSEITWLLFYTVLFGGWVFFTRPKSFTELFQLLKKRLAN